jgi:hypothetical protein
MAVINNVTEVPHRIRVKLYPNYLHGVDPQAGNRNPVYARAGAAEGSPVIKAGPLLTVH